MSQTEVEDSILTLGKPDTCITSGFAFELYGLAKDVVACISAVVLVLIFILKLATVIGPSMYPTLHEGDRLVLLSNVFYTSPKQGDIVVLRKQSFSSDPIVKRIIATAGQTVDINFDTHEVFVDGVLLQEDYINEPTALEGDVSFPIVVKEGCIFVMGDNRNESSDSRLTQIGMVDTRCVLGKVLVAFWPFSRLGIIS